MQHWLDLAQTVTCLAMKREKNDLGLASHVSRNTVIREEKGANPNIRELGFQEMYKCI